ncbi:mCG13781, isoform CRA_a [Mus musculus]|nr:mCG13781, isoform CRA_a [Mus musculus]
MSLLNKQDLEDYEKHLLDMLCYFLRPDKGAHRTAGLFPSPFPNCRTYRKGISVPQGQCACLGCTRRKQKFLFRK